MGSSVEFEDQILSEIENKQYLKAINSLTLYIQTFIINTNKSEFNNNKNNYKYYLMRSYCYQQLLTDESLDMAFDDVLIAIDLAPNESECYLQGAFVYLDQKKFENSFQLFWKSIQINPKLKDSLRNDLIYIKFMALSQRGFDYEICLKYALNYETIGQCLEAIHNNYYKKSHLFKFMALKCSQRDIHFNESLLDNICNNITNNFSFIDNNNNTNNSNINTNSENQLIQFRMRSFSQVVSDSNDEQKVALNYNVWKPFTPDFSSSDQTIDQTIVPLIGPEFTPKKLKNTAICRPNSDQTSDSLNRKSNEKSLISVEKWINDGIDSDNVSKLCKFEKPIKSSDDSDNTLTDEQLKHSIDKSSLRSLQVQRKPTNLHKLRGVYIGNLKTNFDIKVLKNRFKAYGVVQDFYQPSGAGYAFIHFKNHESATNMIADWQSVRIDECRDSMKLMLRFIPTQEQMQKYNSLTYSQYKKTTLEHNECDYWRSGSKCKYGKECFYKHIPINKSIDTLPDKRKSGWKL